MIRIAIDARFLGPKNTGLGTYTKNLIENLERIDKTNYYFVFLNADNFAFYKPQSRNFQKIKINIPYYSFKEQVYLPKLINLVKPDLVHFCHFNVPVAFSGKFVVTIHDLIKHEFSGLASTTRIPLIYWLKHRAYKFVINHAVKKSFKILTPSNWVKKRIIDTFSIDPSKIVVSYEAPEEEFIGGVFHDDNSILKKYRLIQPFLIYVGNLYPYKNLEIVLKAMRLIIAKNRTCPKLIVACPRNIFHKRFNDMVNSYNLNNFVVLPGYVETQDLRLLFNKALALVFPSLSEGFGIPGLNAMAAGLPVLVSDIPVFREVYQNGALYFDPYSPEDCAEKILSIFDYRIRQSVISKGREQIKKYSWRKMAQETLKVYGS